MKDCVSKKRQSMSSLLSSFLLSVTIILIVLLDTSNIGNTNGVMALLPLLQEHMNSQTSTSTSNSSANSSANTSSNTSSNKTVPNYEITTETNSGTNNEGVVIDSSPSQPLSPKVISVFGSTAPTRAPVSIPPTTPPSSSSPSSLPSSSLSFSPSSSPLKPTSLPSTSGPSALPSELSRSIFETIAPSPTIIRTTFSPSESPVTPSPSFIPTETMKTKNPTRKPVTGQPSATMTLEPLSTSSFMSRNPHVNTFSVHPTLSTGNASMTNETMIISNGNATAGDMSNVSNDTNDKTTTDTIVNTTSTHNNTATDKNNITDNNASSPTAVMNDHNNYAASDKNGHGRIAGVIVGVVILLIVFSLLFYWHFALAKRHGEQETQNNHQQHQTLQKETTSIVVPMNESITRQGKQLLTSIKAIFSPSNAAHDNNDLVDYKKTESSVISSAASFGSTASNNCSKDDGAGQYDTNKHHNYDIESLVPLSASSALPTDVLGGVISSKISDHSINRQTKEIVDHEAANVRLNQQESSTNEVTSDTSVEVIEATLITSPAQPTASKPRVTWNIDQSHQETNIIKTKASKLSQALIKFMQACKMGATDAQPTVAQHDSKNTTIKKNVADKMAKPSVIRSRRLHNKQRQQTPQQYLHQQHVRSKYPRCCSDNNDSIINSNEKWTDTESNDNIDTSDYDDDDADNDDWVDDETNTSSGSSFCCTSSNDSNGSNCSDKKREPQGIQKKTGHYKSSTDKRSLDDYDDDDKENNDDDDYNEDIDAFLISDNDEDLDISYNVDSSSDIDDLSSTSSNCNKFTDFENDKQNKQKNVCKQVMDEVLDDYQQKSMTKRHTIHQTDHKSIQSGNSTLANNQIKTSSKEKEHCLIFANICDSNPHHKNLDGIVLATNNPTDDEEIAKIPLR